MAARLENLFSPLRVGSVTVKNRILSTGHDTSLPTDGKVNDALVAYHEARARGGAGLLVVQVVGVHESARYSSHILMGDTDDCIPGLRKLADTVHGYDCRLFVQLFHPGREIMESNDGTLPVAYAPSATPSDRFHMIPRAMSQRFIAHMIECYAATARRACEAGVDGVEIVASHGYLPAQFLNPNVNRRDDQYGGSFENRLRFLKETAVAVRAAAGDAVVGLRISGDEKDPAGLEEATALEAIIALQGDIDYVNVIAGTSASLGGATHIVPPMVIDNAYVAPFAATVKAKVSIPVFVAGRINQPQDAEQVIASGQADMCGMTRAMICDPEMANKASEGRFDDIRACIGCNQACIGHFHKGYPISCIQHPETGRERTFGAPAQTDTPRRVMVVGGGPGGMKAAATAAAHGHDVTLHEASPRLGGQALLAQLLPGRSEFGGIVTNLAREIELSGATVRTHSEVDMAMIASEAPDAIIVATGGKPLWPKNAEFGEDSHVVDAWQVLREQVNVGQSVVVADWRCDWVGVGLAEMLAQSGCHVRLAINGLHAGELLPFYVRDLQAARLHTLGVEVIPYARLYGADADTVYLQHSVSEAPMLIEGVDTLVLAQGNDTESTLLDQLEDYDADIFAVGDCLSCRTAEEAVYEGMKAAWALERGPGSAPRII